MLHFGQTMWLNLIPEKQKRDTDGEMPWHWFWGFDSIAEAPHNSPTVEQDGASAQPAPTQDKDRDIRRAVALKAAVSTCKRQCLQDGDSDGHSLARGVSKQWLAR